MLRLSNVCSELRAHQRELRVRANLPPIDDTRSAPIAISEYCWTPFPDESEADRRRIWLLLIPPLGHGSYGIVLTVAVEVTPRTPDDAKDPRVVLAAMKMAALTRDHLDEAINGLGLNSLSDAGVTPSIARMIDAFAITSTAPITKSQMPPVAPDWNLHLWKHFDGFVYKHRETIQHELGSDAIRETNDIHKQSRLNGGVTVGFYFTELSTRFLFELHAQRSVGIVIPPQDEIFNQHSTGLTSPQKLVERLFVVLQLFDGLHAAGYLHRDIHKGNLIETTTSKFRTSHCALMTPAGRAQREAAFRHSSDQVQQMLTQGYHRYRASVAEYDTTTLTVDATTGEPLLIDFGRVCRATYHEGYFKSRDQLSQLLFGTETTDEKIRNQTPVPVTFTQLGDRQPAYSGTYGVDDVSPAVCILTAPTTNLYTRPFEQLNPWFFHGIKASYELPAAAGYICFHSEYAEVNSIAATLAEIILDFPVFGDVIRTCVNKHSSEEIRQRSRGPRVNRELVTTLASDMRRYSLTHAYVTTLVEPCLPERSHSEIAKRVNTSPTDIQTKNNPHLNPHLYDPADNDIFNCTINANIHDLLIYLFDKLKEGKRACRFFGYTPGDEDDRASVELRNAARAIMARISAVGIPDNLENLKDTILYSFLVGLKTKRAADQISAGTKRRDGWLYFTLHETLTRKWAIDKVYASELTRLLCDALSLDPSARPPLARILKCPIFVEMLGRHHQTPAAGAPNWNFLWSSFRPTPSIIPTHICEKPESQFLARHLDIVLPNLFAMPQTEQSRRYGELNWSLTGVAPVIRLRCIEREVLVHSGIMMRLWCNSPLLFESEAAQLVYYNIHTGALDCYNGHPCTELGRNKRTRFVLDDDFINVHFKTDASKVSYWKAAALLIQSGLRLASWPVVIKAD